MLTPLLAIFFGGPIAVVLTAAGAASIPVIIHLLNRKRFRIVPWAAMRFLLAAQKKNTRRQPATQAKNAAPNLLAPADRVGGWTMLP